MFPHPGRANVAATYVPTGAEERVALGVGAHEALVGRGVGGRRLRGGLDDRGGSGAAAGDGRRRGLALRRAFTGHPRAFFAARRQRLAEVGIWTQVQRGLTWNFQKK